MSPSALVIGILIMLAIDAGVIFAIDKFKRRRVYLPPYRVTEVLDKNMQPEASDHGRRHQQAAPVEKKVRR